MYSEVIEETCIGTPRVLVSFQKKNCVIVVLNFYSLSLFLPTLRVTPHLSDILETSGECVCPLCSGLNEPDQVASLWKSLYVLLLKIDSMKRLVV